MSIADELLAAKDLISDPAHWTKMQYARNIRNEAVEWASSEAHKFCSLGALHKACVSTQAWSFLINHFGGLPGDVSIFNDRHSHQEVMEMWDSAIKQAKDLGV